MKYKVNDIVEFNSCIIGIILNIKLEVYEILYQVLCTDFIVRHFYEYSLKLVSRI